MAAVPWSCGPPAMRTQAVVEAMETAARQATRTHTQLVTVVPRPMVLLLP